MLYFRIRVPINLQPVIQRTEIVQTLGTQNKKEAIPTALDLAGKAKTIFNKLSRDMEDKDLYEQILKGLGEEQFDVMGKAIDESKSDSKQTSLPLLLKEYQLKRRLSDAQDRELNSLIKVADERALKENEIAELKAKVAKLIPKEREKAKREAELDIYKNIALNNKLTANEKEDSKKSNIQTLSPKLSFIIDRYKKECGLGAPTLKKYNTSFEILLELMGDISVSKIDNFDMLQFFVEVCNLPSSMPSRIQRKEKGLKLRSLIDNNDSDCIHSKTFNSHKSNIKLLVEWTKKRYRGAFEGVNVAEVKYDGSRTDGELGQRSFKDNELDTLFRSKEMLSYCKSNDSVYKFWLPVIALYTGMRVNEICQLNPHKDIIEENGISYFLISQDNEAAPDIDKSVKSGTSRVIPIHTKLIELGLFEYTDALKDAGYKRMFPLDKPRERKAGGNTARNFTKYIDDVGLKDTTKNMRIVGMHAFRKTIITKAYREKFIKGLLPIVGHEDDIRDEAGKLLPDVSSDYIDSEAMKVPLSDKRDTIEKVVFDIDFYKPVKPIFKK